MVDNYDSFTFNLVQYLHELDARVRVVRNDECTLAEVQALAPSRIVISPGPCTPKEAGISVELIRAFAGRVPILGVCLGHQCIGEAFGAKVVRAPSPVHGKTSQVFHRSSGVFQGVPSPFTATRYHSLALCERTLPAELGVMAWSEDRGGRAIMGVAHRHWPVHGVQFHPESILSEHGHKMLSNFIRM